MTNHTNPPNPELFQSNQAALARSLLSEALARMTPVDTEGVQFVNGDFVGHERCIYALASVLKPWLPAKYGSVEVRHLVDSATFELCRAPLEERTLERLYERVASKANGPSIRGVVYGFLNLRQAQAPEKLELAGIVMIRTDNNDLINRVFSKERLKNEHQLQQFRRDQLLKLIGLVPYRSEISVSYNEYAGSFTNSVAQVIRPLNTVRALLNLALTFGTAHWHYGTSIYRLSKLWPSPITFVERDGIFEQGYIYESTSLSASSISTVDISENNWKFVNALDHELQAMSQEFSNYLLSLLLLHQQALDATDADTAFLHFWQVVERAVTPVQTSRGFDGNKITHRLKSVMKLTKSDEVVLKELYKTRNDYVHAGAFPDDSPDFYPRTMKLYAETIILWLFDMVKEFPSLTALDKFFEIAPQASKDELKNWDAAISVTRRILEDRAR